MNKKNCEFFIGKIEKGKMLVINSESLGYSSGDLSSN